MQIILLLSIVVPVVFSGRIDTHLHALPPAYVEALKEAGGDPSGYPTPSWTPDVALTTMNKFSIDKGFLSVSSPGVPIVGAGTQGRILARSLNEYLGNLSATTTGNYANRFGFFGTLPDFQDINGTLAELDYLFSYQKRAVGVVVYTTYGGKLPGDSSFSIIWERLNQFKALIFLHPSVLYVTPQFLANGLPQPIVDYPLATTRAAVDLVLSGTFSASQDVDVILSHAGGTLPYLAERAYGSLVLPAAAKSSKVGSGEALLQFKRFYHDTALSTSAPQLDGLLDFAGSNHIIFGSDSPYAPDSAINVIVKGLDHFVATNSRGAQVSPDVLRSNSAHLLSKHSISI